MADRVAGLVGKTARRAALAMPLLLMAGAAFAACSGPVPFFVYGGCSGGKQAVPALPRLRHDLFAPAARVWQASIDPKSGGRPETRTVATVAGYSDPDGEKGQAELAIRCRDDSTSAYFRFSGYEMGNKGPQREIVYQVDDHDEEIVELERAKNHEILSIEDGYRAVPFLRKLIGGQKLRISAIGANGKELRAVLQLEGLDQAIQGVREACHW